MAGIHAKLSASGSKKWLNCPGSVVLEEKFPDESSPYAQEGTAAHQMAELKLRLAKKEITRVQYHKRIATLSVIPDENMELYTDQYKDFVLERWNAAKAGTPDAVLIIESRLDFSNIVPEGFGTGDAVIIGDGVMEVIDLKYGKGVEVSAEGNSQMKLYGCGALNAYGFLYDIQTVRMTIYQPRIDNISTAELTAAELKRWGQEIHTTAEEAFYGSDKFCAGPHCDSGFCKARPVCRAYHEQKLKLAAMDFKKPAELDRDEIAEVLDQADALASWAALVKDYALKQALAGEVFPGFKIVEGRSNRTYADEEAVRDTLTNSGYKENEISVTKLKGITEMEKLLGKKNFQELLGGLVVKPPGKPTLVKAEDKRPEWTSAAADFKNI